MLQGVGAFDEISEGEDRPWLAMTRMLQTLARDLWACSESLCRSDLHAKITTERPSNQYASLMD